MGIRYTCRIRSAGVLVTVSYGHYGQRAARIGPDSICRIRLPASVSAPFFVVFLWFFVCFSHQEGMGHIVQNRPGSDLDGLVRVWQNASGPDQQASVPESSGLISGRKQPAHYQFPTFRLGYILPHISQIILCKPNLDPI